MIGDHGRRGLQILVDLLKGTVTVSLGGSSTIGGDSLFISDTHSILVCMLTPSCVQLFDRNFIENISNLFCYCS